MTKLKSSFLAILLMIGLAPAGLHAQDALLANAERITTPGGVDLLLDASDEIPVVVVGFSFAGGAYLDPIGKEGVADMLSLVLTSEGGDREYAAFSDRLEELALRFSMDAGVERLYGSMKTLSENLDEAFALLADAVQRPVMSDFVLKREKQRQVNSALAADENPSALASRKIRQLLYKATEPFRRGVKGRAATIEKISRADLMDSYRKIVTKNGLVVSVAGDFSRQNVIALVDATFGVLPNDGAEVPKAPLQFASLGREATIELDVPQAQVVAALPGIGRKHDDFMIAYTLIQVLGGAGLNSRLNQEIREKRGLAYGASASLSRNSRGGVIAFSTASANSTAREALSVMKDEITKIARFGVTNEELTRIKRYLLGSYVLAFDNTEARAQLMLGLAIDDLPLSYPLDRIAAINSVSQSDVIRVARILLQFEPNVVIVGQPAG